MASRAATKSGAREIHEQDNKMLGRQTLGASTNGHARSSPNPIGAEAGESPTRAFSVMTLMIFFCSYISLRASHPIIIDATKSFDEETGTKVFLYQSVSVVVVFAVSAVIFCCFYTYLVGGMAQFRSIWQFKPLSIFSAIGVTYALGDFFEMTSMGHLPGASFQLLNQSRVVVAAMFMMCFTDVFQTRLQGILLFMLVCSTSLYVILASGPQAQGRDAPLIGIFIAICRVVITCFGIVLADKYSKVYDDPLHVHMTRINVGRVVALVLLSFTQDMWIVGLFSGWSAMTCFVPLSFLVRSFTSMYIIGRMDSMVLYIVDASSVIAVYAYDVLAPWVGKRFDVATFMAVLVVVAICMSYFDSKVQIQKAALYDEWQTKAV